MSKIIFPLLLDGATQTITDSTGTWNGLTSFVEYNRAAGGTFTIPIKKSNGAFWTYGTLIRVAVTNATQTGAVNISVDGSNIRSLDGVAESTTLIYTVNNTWVPIADENSSGTISVANLTATGTTTVARLSFASGEVETLTQTTSRATAVNASKFCGTVVTDATSLAASTAAEFTINLTGVTTSSKVFLTPVGTTAASFTGLAVKSIAANSFVVSYQNASAAAATTAALSFNYLVV
jgi:hypothetical protein